MELIFWCIGAFLIWKVIQTIYRLSTMDETEKQRLIEEQKRKPKKNGRPIDHFSREDFENDMRRGTDISMFD